LPITEFTRVDHFPGRSQENHPLPNKRIVPLSIIFDRSLSQSTLIKEMIASEKRPLSDSEIQENLKAYGVNIARRTVAKYRSMEAFAGASAAEHRAVTDNPWQTRFLPGFHLNPQTTNCKRLTRVNSGACSVGSTDVQPKQRKIIAATKITGTYFF
jgi:hypothetical protein